MCQPILHNLKGTACRICGVIGRSMKNEDALAFLLQIARVAKRYSPTNKDGKKGFKEAHNRFRKHLSMNIVRFLKTLCPFVFMQYVLHILYLISSTYNQSPRILSCTLNN